jgi:DNA repair protein RecO (recombination protein O)
MLQNTNGIVLRSIKYGETSLITNIFTEHFGVETYLVQGVRSSTARNRAALLQPGTLLQLVAYHQPQKNLQRLREFQSAYLYTSLQEDVVKNSIALFSVELLLKLLPEHAPMPELYEFGFEYFRALDLLPTDAVANFPLYFILQCSRLLGYNLKGEYSERTPHLNLQDGGFSDHPPLLRPFVEDVDAKALAKILLVSEFKGLKEVEMNAAQRFRLLDWYLEFLYQHTQHLGQLKSLAVLQAILH